MDWMSIFYELWENHRGKILGIALGLLVGIGFVCFGFWKTVLLALCIWLGYFIGKKIDAKESIKSFLGRMLQDK